MRKLLLLMILLAPSAFGADHYIYASASGTGTGANCTNAYTNFGTGAGQINPASMTRGDTYWILAGTYTAPTFSTANSGSTVVTVESATAGNHGAAADCGGLYGQAVISGVTTFSGGSGYYTFNGQTRNSDWASGYQLKFYNASSGSANAAMDGTNTGTPNITLQYVEVQGTGTTFTGTNEDAGFFDFTGAVYVGYSYIHDAGCDLGSLFRPSSATVEYSLFARNNVAGSHGQHCQAIGIGEINALTIRYNRFQDITNTGLIDDDNANGTTWTPAVYIYGNVVYWTTSACSIASCGISTDAGLGLFGGEVFNGGVFQIYNNTFAGMINSACISGANVCGPTLFEQTSNPAPTGTLPTFTIYNNLYYNNCNSGDYSIASASVQAKTTADYGEVYCPNGGCTTGTGCAGSQISGGHNVTTNAGNPFVNYDAVSNFNFQLLSDTSAGLSISNWSTTPAGCSSGVNCENTDPLAVLRGANGTIDRGAFQIAGGATTAATIGGSTVSGATIP